MKPLRLHLIKGISEEVLREQIRDSWHHAPILPPGNEVQVIRLRPAPGYKPSLHAHARKVK